MIDTPSNGFTFLLLPIFRLHWVGGGIIPFFPFQVEQLHKIFKLCGTPEVDYWKKYKLPHATLFKPQQQYKRCIVETFKNFPASSFPLIDTLLAIDPATRQTAISALRSEVCSFIIINTLIHHLNIDRYMSLTIWLSSESLII